MKGALQEVVASVAVAYRLDGDRYPMRTHYPHIAGQSLERLAALSDGIFAEGGCRRVGEGPDGRVQVSALGRVYIDELPKIGSGKILWRELQEKEQEKMAETR